jgi:hypothetical protein
MLDRLWLWAQRGKWRVAAIFFLLGAVTVGAFFWNYHHAPVFAVFDAVFGVSFLLAAGWCALEALAK